ncbi:MAG: VWA domain-containing protein, partial [Dehalococcoidia bacterium]
MRFALGALFAGIAMLASAGVQAPQARAQQPQVARVVVGGVTLEEATAVASVTVLDAAGNPVTGLQQGSFTVQVDGQPAQVSAVSSGLDAALPLGVILTIDTSGSMAEDFRLEAAKQAVRPLVDSLQPDDRMALVIFANGVQTLVTPTSDKAQLTTFINALTPSGNTALYAATAQSAALAQALTQPRKAVVFLSDGEEFGNVSGGITREQALAAAAASNVPFFAIGIGQVDVPYLTALAQPAGGQLLTTANPEDLAALYTRIAERLRVQYTVRFPLPNDLDSGDHKVTITAGGVTGEATFSVEG